ncbi:TIGR02117 family protein [Aurantimonas sp. VKM B-3413]|uniref:TIGR02117 family protein n=1 Tax=Aurantimonas sp. VKM B-3413 TaxID=2779401 RepID=UPI001E38C670|nr:TIGR02117 family protein [Aurantimonas sp. VKM B-3413]MCB8837708.1 TIGR02117 family protein [Aurantimonas sp. VKM B-3413]
MTRTRRRRRIVPAAFAILALIAAAVFTGVAVPRTGPYDAAEAGGEQPAEKILVLANPIHTDIALPASPELRQRFGFLRAAGLPIGRPDVAFLVIGWGGRSFYVATPHWSDIRPWPVLKSFFGDASVLHVELTGAIGTTSPNVREIALSADAYAELLDGVETSFRRGPDGAPIALAAPGYGDFDRFYEARGTFQAFAGCNTWTAAMLRRAGLATGLWTPLPPLLFLSLDLHDGAVHRP